MKKLMKVLDSSRVTYGSKITDRLWQDNNGQLIIRDAVLARCGSYDYLESEIIPDGNPTKVVKVYRTEDEVFDPMSIASFENKPFCNDHPDEDVCPDNYKDLQVGFIRDIRRGNGDCADCLIGDIIVTDPDVIELIKSGKKRELSLGYNTQIIKGDDGKYYMSKIRGNHLALVDNGRAGNATIRDNNTIKNIKGVEQMAQKILYKTKNRDKFINKLYDEDVVTIEELDDDDDDVVVEEVTEETVTPETPNTDVSERLASIESKLDQILSMLTSTEPTVEETTVEEVGDEKLPVDEDIVADSNDKPTLYDEDKDDDVEVDVDVDEDEDDDEDEADDVKVGDAKKIYGRFARVGDSLKAGLKLEEEINNAYRERYKKFGGKN